MSEPTTREVLAAVEALRAELRLAAALAFTVDELAELSRLGQGEIYRQIRLGAIAVVPSGEKGRRRVIPRAEAERFLAARLTTESTPPRHRVVMRRAS